MDWLVPKADESVPRWHVSPVVDVSCYAMSWVWVLIPMLMLGSDRKDYIFLYVLVIGATDVHRHYSYPYVYLDKQVWQRYPIRFFIFPGVLLGAWAISPYLASLRLYAGTATIAAVAAAAVLIAQVVRRDGQRWSPTARELITALAPGYGLAITLTVLDPAAFDGLDPGWWWLIAALFATIWLDGCVAKRSAQPGGGVKVRFIHSIIVVALIGLVLWFGEAIDAGQRHGGFRLRIIINSVAVVAIVWNFWHVFMQKYGIMRLYNAKSGNDTKVPGWVDRMLLLGWVPLFVAYLGPLYREVAMLRLHRAKHALPVVIDFLESIAWFTVPVTVTFVVTAIATWIVFEFRANRFANPARLWMGVGTTLLNASFLLFDPVKVYLAFAFSHAVEYMVFVWAFQRRRYSKPLPHNPILAKVLQRPWLAYLGFTLVLGAGFIFFKYYGRHFAVMPRADRPHFMGYPTATWLAYWGIWQSMVHFYFDGFMWKMRHENIRSNI